MHHSYRLSQWGYASDIQDFVGSDPSRILGALAAHSQGNIEHTQRDAWLEEIRVLKDCFSGLHAKGRIYFEFLIPRIGRRVDVVLVIRNVVFTIEFKVGERRFNRADIEQAWDYALDLKNFHETSHHIAIVPILVATVAQTSLCNMAISFRPDGVSDPLLVNSGQLLSALEGALRASTGTDIDASHWERGRYLPTPTIVEAAKVLYAGHSVEAIARSGAESTNLGQTSTAISEVIRHCREKSRKAICFVTGVPGAGKTLVGLDTANKHMDPKDELYSVYLSGNGPLVAVLQEALARDECSRTPGLRKGEARTKAKAFIQIVHHFRDEGIARESAPPEHVAIFDEAQRAWDLEQTAGFMARKKGIKGFDQSEPEFLISCMDRHPDWATVVCLVGGSQEINTGEAGIQAWLEALQSRFLQWDIFAAPNLSHSEYGTSEFLEALAQEGRAHLDSRLHLATSMRSFRAENLSTFVRQVLDLDITSAQESFASLADRYPIVLTRDVAKAKAWLREQARGSERYGIVVSSQAFRLKPHAIDVRPKVDPVHWFLHDSDDIRSSCFMEDVATEFQVQGLELDWACVVWDADLRFKDDNWSHFSFKGSKWQKVKAQARQRYLKNAYRVLLTRARQGMVIVVPRGNEQDPTRPTGFYDGTFELLRSTGMPVI